MLLNLQSVFHILDLLGLELVFYDIFWNLICFKFIYIDLIFELKNK
jgi:hypothetical protein